MNGRPDFEKFLARTRETKFDPQPAMGFRGAIGWLQSGQPVQPDAGRREHDEAHDTARDRPRDHLRERRERDLAPEVPVHRDERRDLDTVSPQFSLLTLTARSCQLGRGRFFSVSVALDADRDRSVE